MIRATFMLAVLSGLLPGVAFALDVEAIDQLLQRPIIGGETTLNEVQEFLERRIPAMPAFSSREEWEEFARSTRDQVLDRVVYRGQAAQWRDANLAHMKLSARKFPPLPCHNFGLSHS